MEAVKKAQSSKLKAQKKFQVPGPKLQRAAVQGALFGAWLLALEFVLSFEL
jgi:hypothetical protein